MQFDDRLGIPINKERFSDATRERAAYLAALHPKRYALDHVVPALWVNTTDMNVYLQVERWVHQEKPMNRWDKLVACFFL